MTNCSVQVKRTRVGGSTAHPRMLRFTWGSLPSCSVKTRPPDGQPPIFTDLGAHWIATKTRSKELGTPCCAEPPTHPKT